MVNEVDLEIARSAAAGDERAQRQIAERLLNRVKTTVTYLAPRHPDADDLVQRALIEILRSIGSFRGQSSLETWADRIATRIAARQLRNAFKRAQVVMLVPDPETPDWVPREDEATRHRLRRRLEALLSRLAPERRTAVVLRFVHGYSIAEIAELTEAPANTVRDRLRIGKALLREYLSQDPYLGADSAAGGE